MPTGEFDYVRVDDILIERDERVRRTLKQSAIDELASSISRLGLIHPILITRDMVLVAGERRLTAIRQLGWDRISIQWADTVSDDDLLALELEENVKRLDLEWQDQVDAMKKFHQLKVETNERWTIADTAEAIGYATSTVSEYLNVAAELSRGNVRVAEAPKFSTAKTITKRAHERRASDEMDSLFSAEEVKTEHPFVCANFNEWATSYSGPPFNLIHCDFPYGIEADKHHQGQAKYFGGYTDTFDTFDTLLNTLVDNRVALMGESAHIILWFSMNHYAHTLAKLQSVFWVDPYPLIWHKADNSGIIPDYMRGGRRVYETAFLCSWGDRKIVASKSNLFSSSLGSQVHMSAKNVDMLVHFFSMVVDENTSLLDPTSGSGSALRAGRILGVNRLLGLEMNQEFIDVAVRAWKV